MPAVKRPAEFPASHGVESKCENIMLDNICSACNGAHAVICLPKCGHRFHTRCVLQYPVKSCQVCNVETDKVGLVYPASSEEPPLRNGKWTPEEEAYVQCVIKEFLAGSLPVGQGTPVRLVLARLLNCSPMRLSKKFQRKALGKHTYNIPKSRSITFSGEEHQERMKAMSKLESAFYEQIVLVKKAESKSEDDKDELRALVKASTLFWTAQFIKFAMKIGQSIVGFELPPAKKIRRAKRPALIDVGSSNFEYNSVSSMKMAAENPAFSPSSNSLVSPISSMVNTPMNALHITPPGLDIKSQTATLMSDDVTIDPLLSVNFIDNMWLRTLDDSSSEPSSPISVEDSRTMYATAAAMISDLDHFLFDPVEDVSFLPKIEDSFSIDF